MSNATRYFIATQGLNRETGQWETVRGEAYLAADYDRLNMSHRSALEDCKARRVLAKCQEKLDPHRDAVLWGEAVRALGISKC